MRYEAPKSIKEAAGLLAKAKGSAFVLAGGTDPAELEAFLDDLLAHEMSDYHIAGAAVSVVKDGRLFFAKGYGYADHEKGIPVDPEQTVFRIGSSGKIFTWTAVMQLVEQGKLDLLRTVDALVARHPGRDRVGRACSTHSCNGCAADAWALADSS